MAAGEGDARARRELVDAIQGVVTAQQRAAVLVHRVTLSEVLPRGAKKTERRTGLSASSVTVEDLVGVYMKSGDGRRPEGPRFFLPPDGIFYSEEFNPILAGYWRLADGRLELTGLGRFTTECFVDELDDGPSFSRFHAALRLDTAPPPEPSTSSELPDLKETRDVVWLTALRRGPDWLEFFDDVKDRVQDSPERRVQDLERAAADLILSAEAERGEAAFLDHPGDADIDSDAEWRWCVPENVVVVTHGMTMRVFLMRWFKWKTEDFELLRNPPNCGIMVLLQRPDGKFDLQTPPSATRRVRYTTSVSWRVLLLPESA